MYKKISRIQYLALKRAVEIPNAIPLLCVLVVENDKERKPLCANSFIIFLDNFKDWVYQKSQLYALVLKNSFFRILSTKSVRHKWILQQCDCKNTFCNTTLTCDEGTVIRPPIGELAFQDDNYWLLKKTLYGLHRSPHCWYNMIKGILLRMELNTSQHDLCLISGVLTNPYYPSCTSELWYQLHVGRYVDDFVFYSSYSAQEDIFDTLL